MRILKAYADAGTTGQQGYNTIISGSEDRGREKSRPKDHGDTLNISSAAREMLASGGNDPLAACPQDATYDQYGNMTRQFDAVQDDLRKLAGQFSNYAGAGAIKGKINSLRSQLMSIQAQV